MKNGMHRKLTIVSVSMILSYFLLSVWLYGLTTNDKLKAYGVNMQNRTIMVGEVGGMIYDRNFKPLIYTDTEIREVDENNFKIYSRAAVNSEFSQLPKLLYDAKHPNFSVKAPVSFEIPVLLSKNQIAPHVIGYKNENSGVTGLLASYNSFLNSYSQKFSVTYAVDGRGKSLDGIAPSVHVEKNVTAGVVTSIDLGMQKKVEKAVKKNSNLIKKGAIIVMDVNSGEITALVSVPSYSAYDLNSAIKDENSPLINRALSPYAVGSCFKMVIAAEALEENKGDFEYECTGVIDIGGLAFHCHNLAGHGQQNIEDAIRNSCNTYFIALAQKLDVERTVNLAMDFGFGKSSQIANNLYSAAGNLPTARDLSISGELANFSFGQGKLTATPVQVAVMTSVIANGGIKVDPKLVIGITSDGKKLEQSESETDGIHLVDRVISQKSAEKLQYYMKAAVYKNRQSNAQTIKSILSAKTSTAQTGRYGEDGYQLYNGWITGFYPSISPQYSVTVICEDAGYGNDVAAPIIKDIIDN